MSFGALKSFLMNIIFLLIAASTLVALVFLASFIWAVRSGQFDDDRSPAIRILDGPVGGQEDMNERKDR